MISNIVLNGSVLGKKFSANAFGAWFADFSTVRREDLQLVSSAPMKVAFHPYVQHEPEDKQQATVKGYSGDDLPVGSLLSLLTSEPDQFDDNQPMLKRIKKKKSGYGRQV